MNKTTRLLSILLSLLACPVACLAQDVEIDWEKRQLNYFPAEINRSTTVRTIVRNVNNLLYDYKTRLTQVPRESTKEGDVPLDWGQLGLFGKTVTASNKSNCDQSLATALAGLNAVEKEADLDPLKGASSGKPRSIRLSVTLEAWRRVKSEYGRFQAAYAHLQSQPDCEGQLAAIEKTFGPHRTRLERIRTGADSSHELSEVNVMHPDSDYLVTITEMYPGDGATTVDGEKEWKFSPQSNALTLSAGVLLTRIQSRSYDAVKVPDTAGTGIQQQAVLNVAGGGRAVRPVWVGLLNYHVTGFEKWKDGGIALSSGLIVQGQGDSKVSPLGFFGGVSFKLKHRFFVTPGVHIGEFADFPRGFTNGSAIPSDFGDLSPTKRWTARFAIAITYRTNKLGQSKVEPSKK